MVKINVFVWVMGGAVCILYPEVSCYSSFALVNVNAPVVATTSWLLLFTAPVVA